MNKAQVQQRTRHDDGAYCDTCDQPLTGCTRELARQHVTRTGHTVRWRIIEETVYVPRGQP